MISQAAILARFPTLPTRCGRLDSFVADRLTACERIADRVAALGDRWGPIVGDEPFMIGWFLLHGLARTGRARACGCAS